MPTVDVIIPAYNAAKFLATAIESVIGQTFEDWRIILVDDGSTDNTAEIAAPYIESLGSKLKYIRKSNCGLPAARNTAIQNSSAEFLALLDADDVWLPTRLSESLKCFEGRPQVGVTHALISYIDSDGTIIGEYEGKQDHAEGWIAPYIYTRMAHLVCPSVTFRRKCVDEVGLFDETMRATEDRDLWFRIALKYQVGYVPTVLALYRISPNSMTTDPNRMLQAQLQFIQKHYGAPGCGILARRRALGMIYKQYAEALAMRQQLWAALRNSVRAMALYPLDISNLRTTGSLLLRCAGITR